MRRSARTLHACCPTVIPGPYIPPSQAEEPDFAARVYSCRRGWNFRMADQKITTTGIAAHGASRLPSVEIDSFNIELKDDHRTNRNHSEVRKFQDRDAADPPPSGRRGPDRRPTTRSFLDIRGA